MSTSQFVCATLDIPTYPHPPKKNEPAISGDQCWLCAGTLDDAAWPLTVAMKASSLSPADARAPTADAVCWQCMALRNAETWNAYVATLSPGHGMKQGKLIGWRNSSHLIADGMHVTPSRSAWRDHLLEPPDPPFLAVFAVSTQLQIIGLAEVAHDRDAFPVQIDRESVWVRRSDYRKCLDAFERLYNMGLTKAQISTGDIPNVAPYRKLLPAWRLWLNTEQPLVRLVTLVAQRTETT